jgi:hypothetical protein
MGYAGFFKDSGTSKYDVYVYFCYIPATKLLQSALTLYAGDCFSMRSRESVTMSDLPLPRLGPNDPENLLSTAARQRISRALLVYKRLRTQARSAIEIRGYWGTTRGFVEMREADMEAAPGVIRAEAEE